MQENFNLIYSIIADSLQINHKYITRYWMYNGGENCGQDALGEIIFYQKRIGNKAEWLNPIISAKESHEINDNWSLVEISFTPTDPDASYELVIKRNDYSTKTIYLDELLIYDNELKVYKQYQHEGKQYLFKNNQRIELSD